MIEQIRAVIQAAGGIAEVPRRRAEELARELGAGAKGRRGVTSLAEEIVKRSRENAAMVTSLVSSEIRRQVKALGLVTRDDLERVQRRLAASPSAAELERLQRRVEKLEGTGPKKPAAKKPASRKTPKTSKTS